jgi:NAD+ synthase (glutamine-hydrolysing)
MRLLKVAAACLNQTPLDWESNLSNIRRAIDQARQENVSILCLPELSLTGYGCEDAFLSPGLVQTAAELLTEAASLTKDMIVCIGVPLRFRSGLYDAACLLANGRIQGFAAKHFLAGEGIHYEPRWFRPWPAGQQAKIEFGGESYPLGDLIFECDGVRIGFEICEDAWAASRPGVQLAGQGVDIILNPSASHFAFGKFNVRKRFVLEGSRAFGVVYLYANLVGNESGRAIYDGGCIIASGGDLVRCGRRFSYADIDLTSAIVDLDKSRLARSQSADFSPAEENGSDSRSYHCVKFDYRFPAIEPKLIEDSIALWETAGSLKEEEFARAVSLGLFDYLRKSRMHGFVVSLSGGADSSGVACLVYLMVKLGVAELGLEKFLAKLAYVDRLKKAADERAVVKVLLTCVYQATRNSSLQTRNAAEQVAAAIGADFLALAIDSLVDGYTDSVAGVLGRPLSWKSDDVALQNIQARARGPLVWLIANVKKALLLATSNRSEAAVGYTTMDGDTCGGLSPIAGVDKAFLLKWLKWLETGSMHDVAALTALSFVTSQQPTAELRPPKEGQTDESDLMPYVVLDAIERLAIRDKKTPLEVFQLLLPQFPAYPRDQFAIWVERFFTLWSQNQWKRERYAPSFHLDDENLDPKTWCRFPILSGGFRREIELLRKLVS